MKQRTVAPVLGVLGAVVVLLASASGQNTAPRPRPYLIDDVRLSAEEDAPRHRIVLRDGRVEAVLGAGEEAPPGLWVLEGEGLVAVPGFVDGYSHAGCETPEPVVEQDRPVDVGGNVRVDMRQANRKGIQPSFAAAGVFALEEAAGAAHREGGFALVLSAPEGELLAGRSVLASTREGARRERIVRGRVFDHAAFAASGNGYPSTLMAYHAQLRQFFLDARRHGVLKQRFERGVPGSRPVHDEELDAGLEILAGDRRLVCEAESARDIRRWIRLADELGLRIAISGGREAHEVADVLAARGIPVFLTLDWGEEVEDPDAGEGEESEQPEAAPESEEPPAGEPAEDLVEQALTDEGEEPPAAAASEDAGDGDWTYEEPLGVRRERRRRWVEVRDGAQVLAEAGVRIAFGTGERRAADLLKAVRTLVEQGFPREVALGALTRDGAELLGVGGSHGRIEPGYAASLALWTGDPLEEGSQVRWIFVDGFPHEFEVKERGAGGGDAAPPREGYDLGGRWELSVDGQDEPSLLTLTMEPDGSVSGTIRFEFGGETQERAVEGRLSGTDVTLEASFTVSDFQVSWSIEASFGRDREAFSGSATVRGPGFENTSDCAARRLPGRGGLGLARSGGDSFGLVLGGVRLESGAPNVPFQPRRPLQPICGCNKHHDHLGHDDGHDDGDDRR